MKPRPTLAMGGLRFAASKAVEEVQAPAAPVAKVKKPRRKNDPAKVAAARELRDRWLEEVNRNVKMLPADAGKYDVSRGMCADTRPAITARPVKWIEAA